MEEFKPRQITASEAHLEDKKTRRLKNVNQNKKEGFDFSIFLSSLLPMLMLLLIQLAAFMPTIFPASMKVLQDPSVAEGNLDAIEYTAKVMEVAGSSIQYSYLAYVVLALAYFTWRYLSSVVKPTGRYSPKGAFTKKGFPFVMLAILGLWGFTEGFMAAVRVLAPEVMENYSELVQSTGLTQMTPVILIVVWLFGPVVEELCFRGLVYNRLLSSGMKIAMAVVVQGLFFGIFHMNLLQTVYAFVLGTAIGFFYERYKSILVSISCHVLFNFLGTVLSGTLEHFAPPTPAYIAIGVTGLALAVFGIVMVCRDKDVPVRLPEAEEA
ncbi:MAG: CPBP family intramembrane metalloprotease [Clostridiales bacterium]|nr:CPBP family intramembrane metalloprotease [Clostridiales bacterium]